jgi:diguanylate cyclase (GGDEF)-like protein/hemerythrin-like metal-binding protein/PAS domain S-box-containing protein
MRREIYQSSHIEELAKEHAELTDVFVWDRQFETHIPEIDRQHQKLVQLINSLGTILAIEVEGESFVKSLFIVFDDLANYVDYHFKFEEELMRRYDFDKKHESAHQLAHADFIRQITGARAAANDHPVEVTARMLTFLSKWLMTHIVVTDMRMAKMILAIQSGVAEEEASRQADSFMSNSTEALLHAMDHLYENLASRTQVLMEAKRSLDREIRIRKLSETELRKFSGAVEHSPISIIITNANGEFEYVNPKFTQLTGYSLAELLGKTPKVLKSAENPAVLYENLWATLTAGKAWHGELRNRKKNGELYWDYAMISPLFDAEGKITHFVSIQEDITERKLADEMLRQQREFSDDIINSLPGIFYMLDEQGCIIRMNHHFLKVTGYSKDELNSMTALDLFEGKDKNMIAQKIQEVFEHGDSTAETELIIKSGLKIPYSFTGHRSSIDGQPYLVGIGTDITERRALQQELMLQAKTDSLTGLSNRRHFLELAEQELARTRRYNKQLSVLILDLDEFKSVNDTHGHQVGDNVLRMVGEVCRKTLREVDMAGRIGGEEFATLLPECDAKQAMEAAERLRQDIANAVIPLEQGGALNFTASIGIITLSSADDNIDKLLELADKAMYEAKRSGRNRVCVARQE